MRRVVFGLAVVAIAAFAALVVTRGSAPRAAIASSHREAPLITEDPTADNTDTYVFRSPDKPDTVTILADWLPGEDPAAGPNWYRFSPTARYDIYVDTNGDGRPDVTYYFRFTPTKPVAFLGNTVETYTVTKVAHGDSTVVGSGLMTPPDNIGPRSTPNYHALAQAGIHALSDGSLVFAGQRQDPFFGDIGAIFDLVAIREGTGANGGGRDFFAGYGVHAIGLQIPISKLDNGTNHVIGVWAAADRRSVAVESQRSTQSRSSRADDEGWVQVSRLGNPLINEVLIPTEVKDHWNASRPQGDAQFETYYANSILAGLLNKLYPQFGPFQEHNRSDLVQVLGTGIPGLNFTGNTFADEIRLNLRTPITPADKVSRLGVIGNDLQGYPNGRRLGDDVIDISERVVGGALIGHSLPLGDGVDGPNAHYQGTFPYETDPASGFDNTKGVPYPSHP